MSALARQLEPEVMDSPEEALDYDSMDHSEVNRKFVDDLMTDHPAGEIIDLGTGTAQIPIELCERTTKVQVLAVDLAVAMLDVARANIEVAGLTDRIMLDRADAKQLPFEDGRFAGVISNSIVHHVPDPRLALVEALRVLAPQGIIFFRDLVRPADEKSVQRLTEKYLGDHTRRQRKMFEESLRAALTLEEMQDIIAGLGYDRAGVKLTSDRHWTWRARKK